GQLFTAFFARPLAAVVFRAPPAFFFVAPFERFDAALAFGLAPRGRLGAPSPGVAAGPDVTGCTISVGRSVTCTVRCAVRLMTRKARPIGADRIRFADGPWFA